MKGCLRMKSHDSTGSSFICEFRGKYTGDLFTQELITDRKEGTVNLTRNIPQLCGNLTKRKYSKTIHQGSDLTKILSKRTLLGDSCIDNTMVKLPAIKNMERKKSAIRIKVKRKSGNSKENIRHIRNLNKFEYNKRDRTEFNC